ncbi:hypothetical protein BDN70DRAFT_931015 [Pholiota conissans]|uniref:Uncharacterized protein n=1 Tax=Pholiota conissans TaxID=109636 RepID=A0A9P6D2A7_9AGAR|nr:hypothetical protein BDN70DRAFT_931015 [Pholiota conissans]
MDLHVFYRPQVPFSVRGRPEPRPPTFGAKPLHLIFAFWTVIDAFAMGTMDRLTWNLDPLVPEVQAPTSPQHTDNVSSDNAGDTGSLSGYPSGVCQLFRGDQNFRGRVENDNITSDSQQIPQVFDGNQKFFAGVKNTNRVESPPQTATAESQARPQPNPMQDIDDDGSDRIAPLQDFSNATFNGNLTNRNIVNANNNVQNSYNGDPSIPRTPRSARSAIPTIMTQPPADSLALARLFFNRKSDEDFLETFRELEQKAGDLNCSMKPKKSKWSPMRIFRRKPKKSALQVVDEPNHFFGDVTNNNLINANNNIVDSHNNYVDY